MLPHLPNSNPNQPFAQPNQPPARLTMGAPAAEVAEAPHRAADRGSNLLFYGIFAAGAIGAAMWIGPTLISAKPAPDFTLSRASAPGADPVSLSDYAGRVVVLDFWASWCGPCRMAIPAMERLHQQYKAEGVKVLGINVGENIDARAFLNQMGANYTCLTGGDAVGQEYGVKGIPTLIVIGKDGSVKFKESGWSPQFEQMMQDVIDKELAK